MSPLHCLTKRAWSWPMWTWGRCGGSRWRWTWRGTTVGPTVSNSPCTGRVVARRRIPFRPAPRPDEDFTMKGSVIAGMISRELRALERELKAYATDDQVWLQPPGLPNSAGTLALHAAGNLLHFVGGVIGGTGYVRDRDGEVSAQGVSRTDLIAGLRRADGAVQAALASLPDARLAEPYPLPVANRRQNTGAFLMHLAVHLAYHLGQVDFHRRVVTGDGTG